jgi:Flp pilus assembly secretin CpaC
MDERPPVTRRHIENEVRVADGETVILGGLRRKVKEDFQDKIPFLGDIPGFGKLFGSTKVADSATEMFIFITPKIIKDPVEDIKKVREEELKKRLLKRGESSGRPDDVNPVIIENRIKVYNNETKPVKDFYLGQNKFVSIDGIGEIDEISNRLYQAIDTYSK